MATTYLSRTFGTATNRKKFTLSMWVKLSGRGSGGNNALLVSGASGQNEGTIAFSNDNLYWTEYNSGSASIIGRLGTSRLFRDYNAWYHLVFVWDSANATAGDRMKLYVNGVEETNFVEDINPSPNYDAQLNNNIEHNIGRQTWNSSGLFNGSMSHIHFCDGQAYQASDFGQADANGVWTIKTSPSVTYGTNGFFILKNGNSVTDQSGNSNNWTVGGGTLTNTEDNPSNVFATMNPLDNYYAGSTFSNGNTKVITANSPYTYNTSTIKMGSGKYYIEAKWTGLNAGNSGVGIINTSSTATSNEMTTKANGSVIADNGAVYENGSYTGTNLGAFSTNDIVMIAFDGVNNAIYYGRNGTWLNSGDPTSGASKTGAFTPSSTTGLDYFIGFSDQNSGAGYSIEFNFGNGYFGTTAVASAGTNASGIGIFEYDVPTGYYSLCTKNINTYG